MQNSSPSIGVQVGANHLGHFLLSNLLLPAVEASTKGPRIVVTASEVCATLQFSCLCASMFLPEALVGDQQAVVSAVYAFPAKVR